MLEIFIIKENIARSKTKDYIVSSDSWFDMHWKSMGLDTTDNDIINRIDNSCIIDYTRGKITSMFDSETYEYIDKLSTGCKTVLNVRHFPDKIFYLGECGNNAIEEILKLKNGKVLVNYYFIVPKDFNNNVRVWVNGKSFDVSTYDELYKIMYNSWE